MKKDEARRAILTEWRRWRDTDAKRSPLGPLEFYNEMREEHPDLLSFKCNGDRYRIVARWVSRDQLAA